MNAVAIFLENQTPALVSYVNWGRLHLDFDVSSYLTSDLPPIELITSVRGIVQFNDSIVVMENEDGKHFMPGGRLEPGESFQNGLTREIKEECGLDIVSNELLGFMHFRHRQIAPENYPYPYPDMFQLVYSVVASGSLVQEDQDGYEFASHLCSIPEALALPDTEPGHPFLCHVSALF